MPGRDIRLRKVKGGMTGVLASPATYQSLNPVKPLVKVNCRAHTGSRRIRPPR